eukprot:6711283-Alexandrium_andersonii.AAC.1
MPGLGRLGACQAREIHEGLVWLREGLQPEVVDRAFQFQLLEDLLQSCPDPLHRRRLGPSHLAIDDCVQDVPQDVQADALVEQVEHVVHQEGNCHPWQLEDW